jgi:hypothetical protein
MLPDLVYFLGRGSPWDNNELRYSLRSAHANLPHRKVVVVGERPAWLTGVIHVPAPDRWEVKVRNTLAKLALAVQVPELSEEFVLMNDDFFTLRPVDRLPSYCLGTMEHQVSLGVPGDLEYRRLFEQGLAMLKKIGVAVPLNYETHHPLPMDKQGVRNMLDLHGGAGSAYPFRSVYSNMHRAHLDVELTRDVKVRGVFQMPSSDAAFASIDDATAKDGLFQAWCRMKWPEPSPYEA